MEEIRKQKEMRKKRKGGIWSNLILAIAVAMFLFSGYKLYTIYSEYAKGDTEYKEVIDEVIIQEIVRTDDNDEAGEKEKTIFRVDFEKLQSINPEAVAWIRFDEPSKISYPVMQTTDNEKYLDTTYEGKKNAAGALFVDVGNTKDFTDRNTFIYGHNMKNGSMFGQLRKYKNADFCKENPYFYIYTPDGMELKYQVFAVSIVEDTAESYRKFYADDNEYLQYLEHLKKIARYDTGVEVNAQSRLVSLSTCTNVTETQRLLVHGVKIGETLPEAEIEPEAETEHAAEE